MNHIKSLIQVYFWKLCLRTYSYVKEVHFAIIINLEHHVVQCVCLQSDN